MQGLYVGKSKACILACQWRGGVSLIACLQMCAGFCQGVVQVEMTSSPHPCYSSLCKYGYLETIGNSQAPKPKVGHGFGLLGCR
jgi:hypothetical protein